MTFRDVDAGVFLALLAAVAMVDQLARRRVDLPSLRQLGQAITARTPGRVLMWFAWWWLGWHFFVR